MLSGGPLTESYILEQFHCHWGQDCSCGSEHTIDGKTFAAEVRIVSTHEFLINLIPVCEIILIIMIIVITFHSSDG